MYSSVFSLSLFLFCCLFSLFSWTFVVLINCDDEYDDDDDDADARIDGDADLEVEANSALSTASL